MTRDYFFEILLEEIPAWMISSRLESLREQLASLYESFAGSKPDPAQIVVGATSRRLYFAISALPEKQADREEEVKGPPVKAAYDAEGKPTRALDGFLKKNNATAADAHVASEYVWLRRSVSGATAADVLTREIPRIIEGMRWPKMMRWGRGENAYIRPIHSVISLLGDDPLDLTVFGVTSGVSTKPHRILANGEVKVSGFADYEKQLRKNHVVIDATERVETMRELCRSLAAALGGTPAEDAAIWKQWEYLTEFPGIVRAEFSPEFLVLPEEVLITVMRVHQKQLPVYAKGKLTNSFLAVMDQSSDDDGNAASGNSFVTNARFADAKFFFDTDRRQRLEERLPALEHLQFQEKLGDYARKTERIVAIAKAIHELAPAGADAHSVEQAARLSKTDLGTEMVKEFTDLQGIVGGIYARAEELPQDVWTAIYDHYRPTSLEAPLPRNSTGAIVALADKLDTLVGFFAIDLKPSGSKDPFALRRAAQGIVQILLNRNQWEIAAGLEQLIDATIAAYGSQIVFDGSAVRASLLEFFAERVRTLLELQPYGFAYDEIAAAMEAKRGWASSLSDLVDRIAALRAVRSTPGFLSILDSAKRIENITAGADVGSVRTALLQEPSEKRLHEITVMVSEQITELVAEKKYAMALESFSGMAAELEQFFTDVMVMVDDAGVRSNRMALLRNAGNSVRQIADVTRIVVARRDYAEKK